MKKDLIVLAISLSLIGLQVLCYTTQQYRWFITVGYAIQVVLALVFLHPGFKDMFTKKK